ncbi:hypothetical protein HRbin01_01848 [archaeon HR01]|nr:hypothetical protein HRbin01_01848 [archaeon HR01]
MPGKTENYHYTSVNLGRERRSRAYNLEACRQAKKVQGSHVDEEPLLDTIRVQNQRKIQISTDLSDVAGAGL